MSRKLLIVALLTGLFFTALGQRKKGKDGTTAPGSVNYKVAGAPLPSLKIYTREGKYLSEKDLENDAHLFIMLFNPTCEHCEEQAGIFRDNIFRFKNTKLMLLAAPAMGPHLSYFTNNAKIGGYPSIQVGLDSSGYIEKTFLYETLPQINIYDKERKLVRMFNGIVPIDSLKAYID